MSPWRALVHLATCVVFAGCMSRRGAREGEPCDESLPCTHGTRCTAILWSDTFRCRPECETRDECPAGFDCASLPHINDLGSAVVCYERGTTAVGERCVRASDCVAYAFCTEDRAAARCVAMCEPDTGACPAGSECRSTYLPDYHCVPDCTVTGPDSCDERLGARLCVPWFHGCADLEYAAECVGLDGSDRVCPLGTICWEDGACVTEEEAQVIWAEMRP